jgi:dGTPase
MNPKIKTHLNTIRALLELLFDQYLADLEKHNTGSVIFTQFLRDMSLEYLEAHSRQEIVRDFIAGMTDQYFLRQCPEKLRPKKICR